MTVAQSLVRTSNASRAVNGNGMELYTDWYHFNASDNEYFFFLLAFGHYTVSATALQTYLPACWMPVAVHF